MRARATFTVAMLYPGYSAQDEYPELERRIGGGVALPVVHTWDGGTAHEVEALRALGSREQLVAAGRRARDLHHPDAVMWACTSGSFVYGSQGVRTQAGWVGQGSGTPASSTTIAFVEALQYREVRRVCVAATYPPEVTAHFLAVLSAAGVEVVTAASHDVPSGEDAGRLGRREVLTLVGSPAPGAEAVLVPDTALHTVALIDDLEAATDCLVLTANQVTAWWGLRLAGWTGSAAGIGRLFAG